MAVCINKPPVQVPVQFSLNMAVDVLFTEVFGNLIYSIAK